MTYRGHVKDGQITLDAPVTLSDGTEVNVEVLERPESKRQLLNRSRAHISAC